MLRRTLCRSANRLAPAPSGPRSCASPLRLFHTSPSSSCPTSSSVGGVGPAVPGRAPHEAATYATSSTQAGDAVPGSQQHKQPQQHKQEEQKQEQEQKQLNTRELRRERRRELLEAAKHDIEWRIFSRKTHEQAAPPVTESAAATAAASAASDAAASPPPSSAEAVATSSAAVDGDNTAAEGETSRKREDLGRRIMRRRLRRASRTLNRDPRLPENVWSAFKRYEVLVAQPSRSLADVQKAVDDWYEKLPFRSNFKAELDMSKAAHTFVPFWHFACNTDCQYQGRARIGRRFTAKYGEKVTGTLSTAFPVFVCAEESTPQRKPFLAEIHDLKWHELGGGGGGGGRAERLVSLTAAHAGDETALKATLDGLLQPGDRVEDVGVQPQDAWAKEGRKRLEEVEEDLSKRAIIEAEEARGILRPRQADVSSRGGDVAEEWEVDLAYVTRTDQEREQGMGRVSLVLVPVYELHYRYRGFDYHLCVRDGDDPRTGPPRLEGTRPYSYAKISWVGLAGLGVGFASYWLITH